MTPVQFVNQILTISTVIAQIGIAALIISFFLPKKQKKAIEKFLDKKAIYLAFAVSLTATLGSLFYSEIAGYEPCKLCWFQRIFMYPQPILFAVAFKLKDKNIIKYSLALSLIGGLIALYHYLLQIGIVPNGACGAVGYSISCSQRFVMEFGYITIPMMSLTAFASIVALLLTQLKRKRT